MSDLAGREFHRILIIKPSSPGDIIHALPVLRGLRTHFPSAHIAWLIASPFAELIEADPDVNEIIRFDRKRFGFLGRSIRITGEFLRFLRQLRSREFDLVIDLQGLFRSGFLARATGAATRVGFSRAREFAWLFYTHKFDAPSTDDHAADRNFSVGSALSFSGAAMRFDLCLTRDDHETAETLLRSSGLYGAAFVVLVPGTRWETKRWSAARFGELAQLLNQRTGVPSILVGGASDARDADEAVRASGGAAVNLCGKTTLRQLAAIIDRAALVVTADSTPMHLAVVMNRPLVALFGPTNPRRTGPYGRMDDVLRLDLPCSPCYFRRLRQCPHQHRCMVELTVEQVASVALTRLAASQ